MNTKKYTELSVDIETLGTYPGNVVLSIGACAFDVDRGLFEEQELSLKISLLDSLFCGFEIDPDTLEWWRKQPEEARQALETGLHHTVKESLVELAVFKRAHCAQVCRVWMKGPSFDGVLLKAMAKKVGVALPWDYWEERDVRTICDGIDEPKRVLDTKHDALDDAIHQAYMVRVALLRRGIPPLEERVS